MEKKKGGSGGKVSFVLKTEKCVGENASCATALAASTVTAAPAGFSPARAYDGLGGGCQGVRATGVMLIF